MPPIAASLPARLRRAAAAAAAVSRPLALLTLASAALLAASLVLGLADGRVVGGAPVWMKPAKFAASVAITTATLAWLLGRLDLAARARRRAAGLVSALLALELVIITVQAARGVPSHFNFATPLDGALFSTMGLAIVAVTVVFGALAVRAFRRRFADRALGWGIRLGLVSMLLGSAVGGLMPRPTAAQAGRLAAGQPSALVGAHAVGVPDGGPGLPLTRWSTEGGDLRVPHFIGLHGLQALPLAAVWLARRARRGRGTADGAARLVVVAGLGYIGLFATTLVQALRGRPLLAPDAPTLALGGAVLAACAIAAVARVRGAAGVGAAGCET